MKIVTVVCNVAFGGFFCMVVLTDGLPKATGPVWLWVPFLIPIFNVVVIRVLSSAGRILKLTALAGNIVWLGLACWRIVKELPSRPKQEGLVEFVVLFALTPLLTAAASSERLPERDFGIAIVRQDCIHRG